MALVSCTRFENIEDRLDILEQKVETLEQAVGALQTAYEGGKIITSVDALDNGYKITFSDNSAININHGKNGITPLLSIDEEGYWMVSYDNGISLWCVADNIRIGAALNTVRICKKVIEMELLG